MEIVIPVVSSIFSGLIVNLLNRYYINSRCCTVVSHQTEAEDIEAEESSGTSSMMSAVNCDSQFGFIT